MRKVYGYVKGREVTGEIEQLSENARLMRDAAAIIGRAKTIGRINGASIRVLEVGFFGKEDIERITLTYEEKGSEQTRNYTRKEFLAL
jgi:hypothetical protein